MIALALAAATAGFVAIALGRKRVAHICNALAVAAAVAYVLTEASDHTLRIVYTIAFYIGAGALLLLAAMVALWPMLEDLFDRPRKEDRRP